MKLPLFYIPNYGQKRNLTNNLILRKIQHIGKYWYRFVTTSNDIHEFRTILAKSSYIIAISGAGISAESGIPTFRGLGSNVLYRHYDPMEILTPMAFKQDPSLVWEFHHYLRELVANKQPNAAHKILAEAEKILDRQNKKLIIITQNIDGFHQQAGSSNVVELHGNLFKTRCTKCQNVEVNRDSPICEALRGRELPDVGAIETRIPEEKLPRCKKCFGLLRPHVVWFGENLDVDVLDSAAFHLDLCDLCLVIGTSSVVYPTAMFAPEVASRGVPVAEFNLEPTERSMHFNYHFQDKYLNTDAMIGNSP